MESEGNLCSECTKIITAINEASINTAPLPHADFISATIYEADHHHSPSSFHIAALAGCGICAKVMDLPAL
jgi:hypothetical protein